MKGFLPSIYAREVATTFSAKSNVAANLKLTAPKAYVRNRANRPDPWEHSAIENVFKAPGHTNGQHFSEASDYKGKPAFRLIVPEYYGESCLKCHGDPKGDLDVTGGKKEGGKLGELGGAISVVLFENATHPASQ